MIQRKFFQFGVLVVFFLIPFCSFAQKGEKIQTIVIDAGHGGKDTGALGRLSTEKSINLSVALKFGAYIEENLPDVKVIYTRTTDKFVELSERAAIANRNNADVFISIHCNSTDGITSVDGAETFVMGESKNEANLNVAKKENSAILLESNTKAYDNFDPNSTEAYIIFSLNQSIYQSQSLSLADKVQKQFTKKVGRHDRGVQQAGFLVLWKTSMPSILVELGFINNMKEEQFLKSNPKTMFPKSPKPLINLKLRKSQKLLINLLPPKKPTQLTSLNPPTSLLLSVAKFIFLSSFPL